MKKVLNVTEDQELTAILGLNKSVVANWKRGTAIQLEQIALICRDFGVSADYLLFGAEKDVLSKNEKLVLFAYNALDDKQKLNMMGAMMGINTADISATTSVDLSNNNGGKNTYITGDNNVIQEKQL